jgi:3-deoxy-D-manno-octulosonate 8-phosphate phosphatase (KDO 8-P phosphatase)
LTAAGQSSDPNGETTSMTLHRGELVRRARMLRLVLTDCDGVLTDAGVYYSERGEELKRFSVRDGMGVACLRDAGVQTGIITGENSPPLVRRAEKLGITQLYQGIRDKRTCLQTILNSCTLGLEHVAYIGDDINDLAIIGAVNASGLTAAPADAHPIVAQNVHLPCTLPGGHGAFREFADWLLTLRSEHDAQGIAASSDAHESTGASPSIQHIRGGHRVQTARARR